jgi:hypothetical protein
VSESILLESILKEEIAERWFRIVGSGDERHLRAGTGISAVRSRGQLFGNLSTYIRKLDQKTPPVGFEDVGRFWGSSRNLLMKQVYKMREQYFRLVWSIKLMRNWYRARLRSFGIRWGWKGMGFTALDGSGLCKQIMRIKC